MMYKYTIEYKQGIVIELTEMGLTPPSEALALRVLVKVMLPVDIDNEHYLREDLIFGDRLSLLREKLNRNWGVKCSDKMYRFNTYIHISNRQTSAEAMADALESAKNTVKPLIDTLNKRANYLRRAREGE